MNRNTRAKTTHRVIHTMALVMSMCLLVSCDQEPAPPPTPDDSWYRPVDQVSHDFMPLPPFLYSPVKLELVAEAAQEMGDGPLLQLSTSEAQRYADDTLRTVRELRPFLIHGLYRSRRTFTVAIADRALWVDSHDSPADTAAVKRQPLVIYIDEVPPHVFVTMGAGQSQQNRE